MKWLNNTLLIAREYDPQVTESKISIKLTRVNFLLAQQLQHHKEKEVGMKNNCLLHSMLAYQMEVNIYVYMPKLKHINSKQYNQNADWSSHPISVLKKTLESLRMGLKRMPLNLLPS